MISIKKEEFVKYENNLSVVRAKLNVDSAEELPETDDFSGKVLFQGSTARDISTGDVYALTSTGEWVVQNNGGGSSDFAETIEFVYDEETDKDYFPTNKLDILRLHKPFMDDECKIWYFAHYETGWGWFYFADNMYGIYNSPLVYMYISEETKEITVDSGQPVYTAADLTAATVTGGTISANSDASTLFCLDKIITNLAIDFTADSNISAGADLIEFQTPNNLYWDSYHYPIIALKSDGTIIPIDFEASGGYLEKLKSLTAISSGDIITITATNTTYFMGRDPFELTFED